MQIKFIDLINAGNSRWTGARFQSDSCSRQSSHDVNLPFTAPFTKRVWNSTESCSFCRQSNKYLMYECIHPPLSISWVSMLTSTYKYCALLVLRPSLTVPLTHCWQSPMEDSTGNSLSGLCHVPCVSKDQSGRVPIRRTFVGLSSTASAYISTLHAHTRGN